MKRTFTLTGSMVEHLELLKDDELLGRALCILFNHKMRCGELTCPPDEHKQLGFIIELLRYDMMKANENVNRMRTVRERLANGSEPPAPLLPSFPEEREISPHTPYIEKEVHPSTPSTPTPQARARACAYSDADLENLFTAFWTEYPRKMAKADAFKAFGQMIAKQKDPTAWVNRICESVISQRESSDWKRDNGKFIPYPATWLRGERWNDTFLVENEDDNRKTKITSMADDLIKSLGK